MQRDGLRDSRIFGGGRRFASRLSLPQTAAFSALLFGACPGAGGGDAGATTDVRDVSYASCVDDEALDTEYDKQLGIDCNAVRLEIERRRSPEEKDDIASMAALMHNSVRRCCVSRSRLVEFMRPPQGHWSRLTQQEQTDTDRVLGALLCDRLTREMKTRLYLAQNPQCLAGEPPPGGPSDIFDAGVSR